jgi:bifunctional non-homologous end joining protein LigD
VFFAFDLLHFAGVDLRKAVYADRRRYLLQCVLPSPFVQLVHASDDGVALESAAVASGFEGVVGKRKDSRYEAGKRSQAWLKVKPTRSADFVIGGYTQGKGSRGTLGSILVGYWDKGKLRFASHVGSGFDERTLAEMKKRLEPLTAKSNPFCEEPERNGPTTWVEPKVVAEVCFHSWTEDGRLRAPVFMRVRDDIEPKKVRRISAKAAGNTGNDEVVDQLESAKGDFTLVVEGQKIKLTNLSRVYWPADPSLQQPALTKRDLLRYFAQVSPYILPHLADRPLTMIRMPAGIHGQRFFQKHWEQEKPEFVESITVYSGHKDESHDYLLCNNLPTLLWLAQAGTLEFHIWHSRATPARTARPRAPTSRPRSSRSRIRSSISRTGSCSTSTPTSTRARKSRATSRSSTRARSRRARRSPFILRELLRSMSLDADRRRPRARPGCTSSCRSAARSISTRRASLGAGRAPPRAPAPEGRHGGVEHPEAHRQDLHGLQHERARQDAERGVFAARRAGSAGLHAAQLG